MNKKRNLWVLIFLILFLLGFWAYLALSPQVMAVLPLDNEINLKRNSEIRVSFSQSMNVDNFDEFFSISPSVEGRISWLGKEMTFTPSELWPEGEKIKVTLEAGAKSVLGLALRQNMEWSFNVSRVRLAHLWPMGVGANLYLLDVSSGDTQQLTFSKGLLDFDVDELNSLVYYSALNAQGGSDLFVIDYYTEDIDRILACEIAFCNNLQISFSGEQIAYEKSDESGISSVWIMSLSGEASQASKEGQTADTAQWSPDGGLVYYDRTEQAYKFLDQEGKLSFQLENITGEPGTWSMTGQKFVIHEHYPFSTTDDLDSLELYSSHLLSWNSYTEQLINLSGTDKYIEDTEPAFSPDGLWIAFARTELDLEDVVIGRLMWIMRSDGTQQRYLTGDPNYRHSAFAWHPAGEQIALLRFNTVVLTEPPEIWLLDVSEGSAFRLIIGGFDPQWIP